MEYYIHFKLRGISRWGQSPLLGWCTHSAHKLLISSEQKLWWAGGTLTYAEYSPRDKENNFISLLLCQTAPQYTHTSTCQRKEHFPPALPSQLNVLRVSILVKTWKEKLPCLDVMEENMEKISFGYGICKFMLCFGMPSSGLYILFTLNWSVWNQPTEPESVGWQLLKEKLTF